MTVKADINDVNKILEIETLIIGHKNRKHMIEEFINSDHCIVEKEADRILGYLLYNNSFYGNNFIELLMVHPKYQKKGIGSKLISHYEKIVGEGKIFTSTNRSNTKMNNLLYKKNFIDSGVIYNLDENDPEMIFVKKL